MTKNKELFYWQENDEWYECDDKGNVTIRSSAPERAKKSFEKWKEHERNCSDESNF